MNTDRTTPREPQAVEPVAQVLSDVLDLVDEVVDRVTDSEIDDRLRQLTGPARDKPGPTVREAARRRATPGGGVRDIALFVAFAVSCALGVGVWSVAGTTWDVHRLGYPGVFTALVGVANSVGFRLRIRATTVLFTPVSAAVVLAAAVLPLPELVVSATIGMLISAVVSGQRLLQRAFGVARGCLASTAAGAAIMLVLDTRPDTAVPLPGGFVAAAAAIPVAALAYAAVDEALSTVAVALATRTPVRRRFLDHWDTRLLSRLAACAIAVAGASVLAINPVLLLALPPMVYALHLATASRLRSREERAAWQVLARTTDELNNVDADRVLYAALVRAAELFSADEVDIEVRLPDTDARLVRGSEAGVSFDGAPDHAPRAADRAIPVPLDGHDGDVIGELRLRFRGPVALTEREGYTLRTFAAALSTALRNATAFARTERMAAEHLRAAYQDPLTGLANRRRLQRHATEVLDRAGRGRAALALIDLNRFKEVNDTLGHTAGDRVLVEIARRLEAAAPAGDLVVRVGGDEFAILLTDVRDPAAAVAVTERMLAAIAAPIQIDGMRLSVEASVGIATADDDVDVLELLRRADIAMYDAKRGSRQVSRYAATRDTADLGQLTLGVDLARAIIENEFVVGLQPVVDLGTAEVIAVEALVRWRHPDHGVLGPDRFLDTIERSARLPAFVGAILDRALTAATDWRAAGFHVPVAVNVSPRSLLDPSFPELVLSLVAAHELPPEALVLEVTESVMLGELEVVNEVLGTLDAAGVLLALDDFGTGYSSLVTLDRLPIAQLKIDKSLISGMEGRPKAQLVRSIVDLGRSLDLPVVAEGVELEETRRRLWDLGCPAGQGYLFAPAMPAEELLAAMRAGVGGRRGTFAEPLHQAGTVTHIAAGRHRSNDAAAARTRTNSA
jgi:diguanylate cyclase (GGDEF)-like protein